MENQKNRTDKDQEETEKKIKKIFEENGFSTAESENYQGDIEYFKKIHFMFAKKHLRKLPCFYASLDSGMPWLSYWTLNILDIAGDKDHELPYDTKLEIVNLLKELQHPDGGFSGFPRGRAHMVSTYAAMMTVVQLGIKEAYDLIDIPKMRNYLLKMKNSNFDHLSTPPSYTDNKGIFLITREKEGQCSTFSTTYPGAFSGHYNGESDLRATYCALVTASILNILDDEVTKGVLENIKSCQTYEGGFAPEPFCEAHGGYSYCAIASLLLLNKFNEIDVKSFVRWLVNRQMTVEGGFNGRTNKLVDSCYSFWQGSIFNMLAMGDKKLTYDMELLFDQLSLQAYILFCCQNIEKGGLMDKPGKPPDLFHTNYASAGMILSEKSFIDKVKVCLNYANDDFREINPIYCVLNSKVEKAINYFKNVGKEQ